MTDENKRLHAVAVAGVLCKPPLPRTSVVDRLIGMGLTSEEAEEVIAYGVANNILAEVPMFGTIYVAAAPKA